MTDDLIQIKVEGIEKITHALDKLPDEIMRYMGAAGQQAAREVLDTIGLRRYPPATSANQPPTPYYIRGRGMQYKNRNDGRSERYGTKYTVTNTAYSTIISNNASYAVYVGGDKQPAHMAAKGWRKLAEVAQEKIEEITRIYQAWVDKAIKDLGL